MPTDDLARFCCQNSDCPKYGQRDTGNLSVCGHFAKANHRLLYCNACQARFSEFKGTPLFNSKLPHDKVLAILQHLAEGCGVRQTARLVGVNKDTVTRLALLAGQHAQASHDELVAFSPRDPRGPVR
jgi:LacI family transcriptional regulator